MSNKLKWVLFYLASNLASSYFGVWELFKELVVFLCKGCIEVLK